MRKTVLAAIAVTDAWVRTAPAGGTSAAYFRIANDGAAVAGQRQLEGLAGVEVPHLAGVHPLPHLEVGIRIVVDVEIELRGAAEKAAI